MKKLTITLFLVLTILTAFAQNLETFNGCPPEGDAKGAADQNTNKMKNRYAIPGPEDIDPTITLEKMLTPGDDENRFSESNAATITGYVVDVKSGSKETCNCHNGDPLFMDTHIEVVIDKSHAGKNQRVIVEVTPRLRAIMADKGIDWTTDHLKNLEGKQVSFSGWLLWDWRHKKDAENTDPGGSRNWRATSWEIHPVTDIEIMDDPSSDGDDDESGTTTPVYFTAPSNGDDGNGDLNTSRFVTPPTKDPGTFLQIIVISAILGMCGQVIRAIGGLKKAKDAETDVDKKKIGSILTNNLKYMAFTLFIAVIVGGVAGVLVAITSSQFVLDKSTIIALVAAGYAGTDLIESFAFKR